MLTFNIRYFVLTIILLLVEVLIGVYVHDAFIRPHFGDFLVVILLYCFVKSFVKAPVLPLALAVLLFSFVIETLQYFHFISFLGLQDSTLARMVLGSSFAWSDLVAYTLGIVVIMIAEKVLN